MQDTEFDTALVGAALALAGEKGWPALTVARAAQQAGLDLGRARARFPAPAAVLLRLGVMADQAALAGAATPAGGASPAGSGAPARDRLFDMIMQRLDVLQAHREGVRAVLRAVPVDPGLALLLASATQRSMRWLLEAAGIATDGLRGGLRVRGLVVVWLYVLRAWDRDDSADLAGTMRALDDALQRAEQAARWLGGGHAAAGEPDLPAATDEPAPMSAMPVPSPPSSAAMPVPSPPSPAAMPVPSPPSPAAMPVPSPPSPPAGPVTSPLPAAPFDTTPSPEPPPPPPMI